MVGPTTPLSLEDSQAACAQKEMDDLRIRTETLAELEVLQSHHYEKMRFHNAAAISIGKSILQLKNQE